MYEIEYYTTSSGRTPLKEFKAELAKDPKKNGLTQVDLIEMRLKEYGFDLNRYFSHSYRKMDDELYELRPGGNRIFFFHYDGKKFVLLHGFKKKSQETPKNEIEKAKNEIKDYKLRNKK